jgi:hypothetical protein
VYNSITVDGFLDQRPVRQRVVHRLHVSVRQTVVLFQARPAVRAVEELVDEAEAQVRVLAKVGYGADALRGGHVFAHSQGVVVPKAERLAHPNAVRGERVGQVGRVGLEDLVGDSSGVFGVNVDVALGEGQPQGGSAAEVVAASLDPSLPGQLRRHLAQDHRLGEFLRADDNHRLRRAGAGTAGDQHQGDDGESGHVASWGTCGPRWA